MRPSMREKTANYAVRRKFKLLTFNIYDRNNNLDAIWSEIQRHNADVVLLIEFGPSKNALLSRLKTR